MARGRAEADWERTSVLCAVLVNASPFREGEPVLPDAFNPYVRPAEAEPPPVLLPLTALRASFVRGDQW